MLNKKVFIPIACFVTFFPLLCFGFDCNRPDFGSPIQDLNKDGYFIKYMETQYIREKVWCNGGAMKVQFFQC